MIAEIKHKMVCGLEDELTGNFFGNMRYLPFSRGLKTVLSSSVRGNDPEVKKIIENIGSDDFVFEFWKRSGLGYGEIDCYMEIEDVSIGVEVKYKSDLSGENQLEREAKMLNEWSKAKEKILVFIASEEDARRIYLQNCKKECFDRVHLAYITWQEILISLDKISANTVFEDRVVNDIRDYLKEKGFSSFSGFHTTDLLIDGGLYYEFG